VEFLELEGVRIDSAGRIEAPPDVLARARAVVDRCGVAVLRGACDPDTVRRVREELHESTRSESAVDGGARLGSPNYTRLDDESKRHLLSRDHVYRRFLRFPWNYDDDSVADRIGRALVRLRNAIWEFEADRFISPPFDEVYGYWTAIHYPRGGAFLDGHRDAREPAMAEVSLALSRFGEDFRSGGLWIENEAGERESIDARLERGDRRSSSARREPTPATTARCSASHRRRSW